MGPSQMTGFYSGFEFWLIHLKSESTLKQVWPKVTFLGSYHIIISYLRSINLAGISLNGRQIEKQEVFIDDTDCPPVLNAASIIHLSRCIRQRRRSVE